MKKLYILLFFCAFFVMGSSLGQTFPVIYNGSDPQTTAVLTYIFCTASAPNQPCNEKSLSTPSNVPLQNGTKESVSGSDTSNLILVGLKAELYTPASKSPVATQDFSQTECSSSPSQTLNITASAPDASGQYQIQCQVKS